MKKLFLYVQTADGSGWKSHEYTEISELQTKLTEHRIKIHPTATIGNNVYLGDGCEIGSGATIGNSVMIGDMASISSCATLERGANIGNYANIHFQAKIGLKATIEYNATIGQGTTIGSLAFIGAYTQIGADTWIAFGSKVTVPFVGCKAKVAIDLKKSICIQGSMHKLSWWGTDEICIGCVTKTLIVWEAEGRTMARNNGYTDEQITEYFQYLDICKTLLKNG